MTRYLLPLGVFIALVAVFAVGLTRDPKRVPSPLINQQAPAFSLPLVSPPDAQLSDVDLKGEVSLLNVWASWCVACRTEHPFLMKLAREGDIPLYGLDYKDTRPNAMRWLQQFGNPYRASAFDESGEVGIDWGVYGVPETFVLDQAGMIRHKHIGPITPEIWESEIAPLIARLREDAS
jgi:cytochrome c biogenesis protein CcmG/thiol:disulfide interchange protein DsbE